MYNLTAIQSKQVQALIDAINGFRSEMSRRNQYCFWKKQVDAMDEALNDIPVYGKTDYSDAEDVLIAIPKWDLFDDRTTHMVADLDEIRPLAECLREHGLVVVVTNADDNDSEIFKQYHYQVWERDELSTL